MPVFGLVLTLSGGDRQRRALCQSLVSDTRITVGEASGAKLPVVLEVDRIGDGDRLVESLLRTPGVLDVAFAFVDWEDVWTNAATEASAPGARARKHARNRREQSRGEEDPSWR